MSIESPGDLESMRLVAQITRETLDALARQVRAGITTGELDAIAAAILTKHGARSAPALVYGFPGRVLISINDEIVHGIPGPRALQRGDLVKLDVTVEKDGYIADAARSVIVDASSRTARRMVACVEAAFNAAAAVARAGTRVNEIGRAVEREVRRHGFAVVRGLSGHGVGRTIHEEPSVPNQYNAWQRDVLTEGLVLTIEPMITAGSAEPVTAADGWTIRTRDGSLSAHHEHTLVITRDQPLILTAA
jgi:methionyl aminopeptidase